MKRDVKFYEKIMRYVLCLKPEEGLAALDGLGDAIDEFEEEILNDDQRTAFISFFDGTYTSAFSHIKEDKNLIDKLNDLVIILERGSEPDPKLKEKLADIDEYKASYYEKCLVNILGKQLFRENYYILEGADDLVDGAVNKLPENERQAVLLVLGGPFYVAMRKFRNPVRFRNYRKMVDYDSDEC